MERGQAGKRPARADCEPSLHGRGQMERKKSPAPVVFVRPFGSRATPQSANAASSPWKQGEPRVLTKYRKNEALIRNDGVYVISGIFCRANACVCGKNAFPPRPLAANRQICKRSGRFVGKPEVCQRSELPFCERGAFWALGIAAAEGRFLTSAHSRRSRPDSA